MLNENMDPVHLSEEELHEELTVRQIKSRGPAGIQALQSALEEERTGRQFPPRASANLKSQGELRRVRELYEILEPRINDYAREADDSLRPELVSKYLHLANRTKRLTYAAGTEGAYGTVNQQVKELGTLLSSINASLGLGEELSFQDAATGTRQKSPNRTVATTMTSSALPNVQISIGSAVTSTASEVNLWDVQQNRISDIFANRNVNDLMRVAPPHSDASVISAVQARSTMVRPELARNVDRQPAQQYNRQGTPCQMAKWNLRFHGNGTDMWVDDFLFRTETLARAAIINVDVLPLGMHYLLFDDAQEWFLNFYRNNPNATWAEFSEGMRHQYSPIDSDLETYDKIRNRKQRPGENFAKFSVALSSIATRLTNRITERELIQHLRANMSPGLRKALLYQTANSVYQLQNMAKEYEKLLSESENSRQPIRRVNELATENIMFNNPQLPPPLNSNGMAIQWNESVNAIAEDTRRMGIDNETHNRHDLVVCWNCDEMGHAFSDCEVATRNVFCYGCGTKNTYKPSCPKCNSGNLKLGGQQHRSRPTPSANPP